MRTVNKDVFVPDLKVFEAIKVAVSSNPKLKLANIAFICTQHELATTINLFDALIQFGAKPENIYLIGKHYSTCEAVGVALSAMGIQRRTGFPQPAPGEFASSFKKSIQQLWSDFLAHIKSQPIKGIIILDDGGRCLAAAPEEVISNYPIIGIEQTTGGLTNPDTFNLPFPVIEVASSASKLWLESPIIATAAITQRVKAILAKSSFKPVCGIVGAGFIGRAVSEKLLNLGYNIIIYDKKEIKIKSDKNFVKSKSIEDIFEQAQYIFGCTGYDITHAIDFKHINENKLLLSCSSEDREFLSLVRLTYQENNQEYHPLDDLNYKTKNNANLNIMRGGFPITFDGSSQPAAANDIQLTQGLLLGALLQAVHLLPDNPSHNNQTRLMLDPTVQQFITQVWLNEQEPEKYSKELSARFKDREWIKNNSGGQYERCDYIDLCFRNEQLRILE
jgi:S-adenosylhomocysteine hydrolase